MSQKARRLLMAFILLLVIAALTVPLPVSWNGIALDSNLEGQYATMEQLKPGSLWELIKEIEKFISEA